MKRIVILLMVVLIYGNAWADNPDPIALIGTPENWLDVEQIIDIEGIASPSRDSTTVTWVLEYGEGESPTTWTQLATGNSVVGYPRTWQTPDPEESDYGLFYSWDTTTEPDGYYTVRLAVTDGANKTATDQVTYYFDNLQLYGSEDYEPGDYLLDIGSQMVTENMVTINALTDQPHGPTSPPGGPNGVPYGGTYMYVTPKTWYGRQLRADKNSWRVQNGRIVETGETWCKVIWDRATRVEGTISYVTKGHKRSWARTVGVWNINVITDQNHVDREKIINTANVNALPNVLHEDGQWYARAISADPLPAIKCESTVYAYGPTSGKGLASLKAGFLQAVHINNLTATFTNNRTQQHYHAHGKSFRDCASPNKPWLFDGQASSGGQTFYFVRDFDAVGLYSGVARISMRDTPSAGWPRTDKIQPYPTLRDAGYVVAFNTWVQVATQEQDKEASNYTQHRQVNWTLNMCGSYNGNSYVPGAGAGISHGSWGGVVSTTIYTGGTGNEEINKPWYGTLIGPR